MKCYAPNLKRIERDMTMLSKITLLDNEGQTRYTRISFSKEDLQARNYIAGLMKSEADLDVRVDAVGNLIGRREGKKPGPAILVGSHLDTVMGGGRFDGIAGVVAGLEAARRLKELDLELDSPLEVIAFIAEEPSPFGLSCVGSRAMEGVLTKEHLQIEDDKGRTLAEAIRQMEGDPDNLAAARRNPKDLLANLELHTDQGPILENEEIPVGVVTGIVGIYRGQIELTGKADHSGTTPMEVRRDALTAASEVVLVFEEICREIEGLVGTIGKLDVFPNSLNVVPGSVSIGLEVRSLSDDDCQTALARLGEVISTIAKQRDLQIDYQSKRSSAPLVFPPELVERMDRVCCELDIPHRKMSSGAGHDASHMGQITDSSMVFIPSKGGRSHCPEEWSEFEHLASGTDVLTAMIVATDKEKKV